MLIVPSKFNRNAPNVRAQGSPTETGAWLIGYMCERLGIPDLGGCDVLDFGCGTRFAEAILNRGLPVGHYLGIDVYREMIDFLTTAVDDPRLSFRHLDARNPLYNPTGAPMTVETLLPLEARRFDIICLFSVITHQVPEDADTLFALLRGAVKPTGRLFFSASLGDDGQDYRERDPDRPGLLAIYGRPFLTRMLASNGWAIESHVAPNPRGLPILDSFVCAPV